MSAIHINHSFVVAVDAVKVVLTLPSPTQLGIRSLGHFIDHCKALDHLALCFSGCLFRENHLVDLECLSGKNHHRLRRLVLRLAGCSSRVAIVRLLEGHEEELRHLTLDVRSNRLNTTGATAINDALLCFRQLRKLRLRLSFNPVGNAGIPNLSTMTHLRSLTLSLDGCDICDAGVVERLSSLERLRDLNRRWLTIPRPVSDATQPATRRQCPHAGQHGTVTTPDPGTD